MVDGDYLSRCYGVHRSNESRDDARCYTNVCIDAIPKDTYNET